MNTTVTGRQAEAAAAAFLTRKGCQIIAQNWKTRMCEIDVIASRDGIVYFCEVKYRKSSRQGSGLDYITSKKLQQMRFAAESWVLAHDYRSAYQLCAIEVTGDDFRVTNAITDL